MKTVYIMIASLVIGWLAGCSSLPKADIDWNENHDFSQVKTYNFIDREKLRSMTPLTSDIARNRIENAVERVMKAKGIKFEPDASKADTLVSYHVTTKDKQDIRTYNMGVDHCMRCRWGRGVGFGFNNTEVRVTDYVEGTLIVDMIDPATSQSVWRGQLSAKITEMKSQQERIDAINYAVETILANYPPVAAVKK